MLAEIVTKALAAHRVTDYEVMACDPSLADTAAFCEAYGIDQADSANTILVASRRPAGINAACVVLATHRLDVNRSVRSQLGVKKLSFASAEVTMDLTDMEIGGVTPFGLPDSMRVLVDAAVFERSTIVLGGGNRSSKLRIAPVGLASLPAVEVVEGLASPA
jgi:prolyl-tRNA editing enzyme YbaK/EbsC (Cys-tRNA(Pro) deacylase)